MAYNRLGLLLAVVGAALCCVYGCAGTGDSVVVDASEYRQPGADETEYRLVSRLYGLDREANFEGQGHLHGFGDPESIAEEMGISPQRFDELLANSRRKLFEAREQRTRPGRDEKRNSGNEC